MNTTGKMIVVAFGLGAASLLADTPASPKSSSPVAKQATAGIQYNPTAANNVAPASPVANPVPASPSEGVTALPAVNVTEQEKHTMRDVDHDVKVTKWLEKPSVYSKPLNGSVQIALLSAPKEGANGKAEEPVVDLEW